MPLTQTATPPATASDGLSSGEGYLRCASDGARFEHRTPPEPGGHHRAGHRSGPPSMGNRRVNPIFAGLARFITALSRGPVAGSQVEVIPIARDPGLGIHRRSATPPEPRQDARPAEFRFHNLGDGHVRPEISAGRWTGAMRGEIRVRSGASLFLEGKLFLPGAVPGEDGKSERTPSPGEANPPGQFRVDRPPLRDPAHLLGGRTWWDRLGKAHAIPGGEAPRGPTQHNRLQVMFTTPVEIDRKVIAESWGT